MNVGGGVLIETPVVDVVFVVAVANVVVDAFADDDNDNEDVIIDLPHALLALGAMRDAVVDLTLAVGCVLKAIWWFWLDDVDGVSIDEYILVRKIRKKEANKYLFDHQGRYEDVYMIICLFFPP